MQKLKIVVLDGKTMNPGDLDWSSLKSLGDVTIFDSTEPSDIITRAENAQILVVNKVVLNEEVLSQLPSLKMVAVSATGYNNVDVSFCDTRNVLVANVAEYSTYSVAQHIFSLILELTNHVHLHNKSVHEGEWHQRNTFSYQIKPVQDLFGSCIGIYGFGAIGKQVHQLAKAFGLKIMVHTRSPHKYKGNDVEFVSWKKMIENADFLVMCASMNQQNIGIVDNKCFDAMKQSSILINTSRGGLINENDLANALLKGKIRAAAVDVLSAEPPAKNHPLVGLKNCIITPHLAWASKGSRERLLNQVVENIRGFINQKPINIINSSF